MVNETLASVSQFAVQIFLLAQDVGTGKYVAHR